MHWCDKCDEFPKTAKDYLTHLHSKDHQSNVTNVEAPWHENMKNDVSTQSLLVGVTAYLKMKYF